MAAIDYTTLAEVEAYAGVDFSLGIGPTEAQVGTMITNASRLVDTYARHTVAEDAAQTYTQYVDVHRGMEHCVLANRPVVSITSLVEIDDDGSETAWTQSRTRSSPTTADKFWLEDGDAGIVRFMSKFVGNIKQFLKFTYTAGRTAPTPEAKMATILLVVRSAGRAAMNDDNCTERIKEFWRRLIDDSAKELKDQLELVKGAATQVTATYGLGGGL